MSELTITCPRGADTHEGAQRSGDFALSWTGPDGAVFRLVERPGADDAVTTLYEGPQRGSTVTGRTGGEYGYQVALVEDGVERAWSEPCSVLVVPYPLSLAFVFFGFGLVVTLATVVLIVRGHRAHRRGELG